jgi:reactive intermediate/imine deaminase
MAHEPIHSNDAPKAVGAYSQAMKAGPTVYLSGQIPLDPATSELVEGSFEHQIARVFDNLKAVSHEAGGSLDHIVKLNVYLTDLANYPQVNSVMEKVFKTPFPARAVVQVAALPLGVAVEIDGVMVLDLTDYSY